MSANTDPRFTGTPNNGNLNVHLVTGDGAVYDGTGSNAKELFVADATNGSYLERVDLTPGGSNATASVARFWLNNGSSAGTASNNTLIGEISLPTITASQSAAQTTVVKAFGFWMKPGYRLIVGMGNTPGSAGWYACAYGGNY